MAAQLRGRVRDSFIDVGHEDRHAVVQQTPSDLQAQPPRGAGHDGNSRWRRELGMRFRTSMAT